MRKSVIALMLCLLMVLPGCNGTSTNKEEPDNDVFDDTRIVSLVSEEGTYTDEYDCETSYSYNIPQIDSKADNAQLINGDIAYLFGTVAEKQLKLIEEGKCIDYPKISYETYWNDSILSLVITANNMEEGAFFGVYNYDFKADSLLTNREITTLAGMSFSALEDSLVYSEVNYFDETFRTYWSDNVTPELYDPYYMECRVAGITEDKIDEDLKRLYLNNDGELMCIAEIGCMAGSGWMFCNIPVEKYDDSTSGNRVAENKRDFINAAIESNGRTVAVWFDTEGDYIDSVVDEENLGKEFTVQGTYSEYTDVFIGNIGDTFNPYLFLITVDGSIEYANILDGINYFGNIYCGGPLCQVKNIESVYDPEVEGEEEDKLPENCIASDSEGNGYSLSELVYAAEYTFLYGIEGEWSTEENISKMMGDTNATHMNIIISEEDGFAIGYYNFDENVDEMYIGRLVNLGMSREGIIYGIIAQGDEGIISSAVMLTVSYESENDLLTVNTVSGNSIFGEAKEASLVRTFG